MLQELLGWRECSTIYLPLCDTGKSQDSRYCHIKLDAICNSWFLLFKHLDNSEMNRWVMNRMKSWYLGTGDRQTGAHKHSIVITCANILLQHYYIRKSWHAHNVIYFICCLLSFHIRKKWDIELNVLCAVSNIIMFLATFVSSAK